MLLLPRVPSRLLLPCPRSTLSVSDPPRNPRFPTARDTSPEHSWLKIGENPGKRRCVSIRYVTSGIQQPIRYHSSLSLSLVCEFQPRQQSVYRISHFVRLCTHSKLVAGSLRIREATAPRVCRDMLDRYANSQTLYGIAGTVAVRLISAIHGLAQGGADRDPRSSPLVD